MDEHKVEHIRGENKRVELHDEINNINNPQNIFHKDMRINMMLKGTAVGNIVEENWKENAKDLIIYAEKHVNFTETDGKLEDGRTYDEVKYKLTTQTGRMDIFGVVDSNLAVVAEVKNSDFNSMKDKQVVIRNVNKQIRQIWKYIDSEKFTNSSKFVGVDICPGVIFSNAPKNDHTKLLIEELFNDNGIQVVWMDE